MADVSAARLKGWEESGLAHPSVSLEPRYESPLRELRFAVECGRDELFFQHPDGMWEGGREPNQIVMPKVLPLEELRRRIHREAGRRDPVRAGSVERRRGALGSKEIFAGVRGRMTQTG